MLVDADDVEIGVPVSLTTISPSPAYAGELTSGIFVTQLLGRAAIGEIHIESDHSITLYGTAWVHWSQAGCMGEPYVAVKGTSMLSLAGGGTNFHVADLSATPITITSMSKTMEQGICLNGVGQAITDPMYPAVPIQMDFREPYRFVVRQ
ncbi:MAG: hypothetical protein AB7I04_16830 [Pseudomonadales bacterium]